MSPLPTVRFNRRYYVDKSFNNPGCLQVISRIIAIIADPESYQTWLQSTRAQYAAYENAIERGVHEIRDDVERDDKLFRSHFRKFRQLPSELLLFDEYTPWEDTYIIDLDREVLTIPDAAHLKLEGFRRLPAPWLCKVFHSLHLFDPPRRFDFPYLQGQEMRAHGPLGELVLGLDLGVIRGAYPEQLLTSLALELPEPDPKIEYKHRMVTPKTDISEARKAFLTFVWALTLMVYDREIILFGREWSPDSFPFRELAFALVCITSDQASFHAINRPHPSSHYNDEDPYFRYGLLDILLEQETPGWIEKKWTSTKVPCLQFGSMCHLPGKPPGISPTETMYWFQGVLISLTLVTDGAAITKAVAWGLEQGRSNFQIVVLSLFQVAFAEVFVDGDEKPCVKWSEPLYLSPKRAEHCFGAIPQKPFVPTDTGRDCEEHSHPCYLTSTAGTSQRLQRNYSGVAALVNFFEVAANRRAVSKSNGVFPMELYYRVVDFVDCDTLKACAGVSRRIRHYCHRKYRLDDRMRIVAGPFEILPGMETPVLAFDFEDMTTGEILSLRRVCAYRYDRLRGSPTWVPIVGMGDRRALIPQVVIQFQRAGTERWLTGPPSSEDES
ncbi:hypothetical protein EKO27_g11201 [Xylaria grammica]|uniref:F-box domain-containing protein n=1 Tax=Xylaria grammica TaxID=363999 RepID=A0A439CP28_9PEZI|nr:hypothetical protein EKO27_g11201 [Xylaria grammica]